MGPCLIRGLSNCFSMAKAKKIKRKMKKRLPACSDVEQAGQERERHQEQNYESYNH